MEPHKAQVGERRNNKTSAAVDFLFQCAQPQTAKAAAHPKKPVKANSLPGSQGFFSPKHCGKA